MRFRGLREGAVGKKTGKCSEEFVGRRVETQIKYRIRSVTT